MANGPRARTGSAWEAESVSTGATVQKIKAAGGQVFAEPFHVMGEGTMAVVADPSGATFGLLQPPPEGAPS
jgi:predicted enzyme related to lactoylglutathione lyase